MRSAKAPIISAGVMMANMPWNITKTYSGIVPDSESGVTLESPMPFERSPMKALPSPKARL
jgi:hypothetical protein